MTRHRLLLCGILLALVGSSAFAETNLNLVPVGIRDERASEERLPAISLAADFGASTWIVRPEVGIVVGFDPLYGASETELAAGVVHYWNRPKMRIHLGGGLAAVSVDRGYNDGSTHGGYLHTGVSWPVGKRLHLGLDLRSLWADSFRVDDYDVSAGYQQIAFLMGWRF